MSLVYVPRLLTKLGNQINFGASQSGWVNSQIFSLVSAYVTRENNPTCVNKNLVASIEKKREVLE